MHMHGRCTVCSVYANFIKVRITVVHLFALFNSHPLVPFLNRSFSSHSLWRYTPRHYIYFMDCNDRSLYDIVYSCVTTIVLSVCDLTKREEAFWTRCNPFHYISYCGKPLGPILSLMFPEWMLSRAVNDWLFAKRSIQRVRKCNEGIFMTYFLPRHLT